MNKNKVAIFVENGMVTGVRSTIEGLEVEVIDTQDKQDGTAEERWEQIQLELPFINL